MIKFGTDGWRAIMADEFTFANVELVVQAIANYLKKTHQAEKGIVVGYDQRFLSDHFARRAAEVLLGNGIRVFLSDRVLPTPVTAYAIAEGRHDGALMFTASHNPPEYNGIKFIPYYAGPALPEVTNGIEEEVKILAGTRQIFRKSVSEGEVGGDLQYINPMNSYIQHIESLLNPETFRSHRLKVLINPMYGAGSRYLSRILGEAGCMVEEINCCRDPLFGGTLPEPTADVLKGFCTQVETGDYDLGLALDGDADRFGIIDRGGTYISPNQVLALLLDHLYTRGERGPVARTVATTHLLDVIAARFGEQSIEAAVGFKYMGAALREGAVLGGEESGGLSVKGHIPEKDGILACCLMAEIMAARKMTFTALLEELSAKYGHFVSRRLDEHYEPAHKEALLTTVRSLAPVSVAGIPVKKRIAIDGTKLVLEDGSWCLMRPSGTEPLVRIYVETADEQKMRAIQQDVKRQLGLL